MSNSSRRTWLSLLSATALLTLTACGSTKPEPAPLERLADSAVRVNTVWSKRTGAFFSGANGPVSLAVNKGVVTVANTDGDVLALNVASGQEVWRLRAGSELTAAVGGDGRYAAVVDVNNDLRVFDQGKPVWTEHLPGRVITAPFVAGERVFVQAVDRSVRAYDVLDGRWLWQYQRPGGDALALASPGVVGAWRDTLLVGQGARLVGLDPVKGVPRFDLTVGTPRGSNEVERLADLVGPLARAADNDICVRAFQLSVACVDVSRGGLKWTRPQSGVQAVAASTSLVVGADGADRLSAWKAETGDIAWRVDRFTHRGLSAPAVVGDRVVTLDNDGYLHVLAAADGRTLTRVELDSGAAAAPVVVNQTILVTTRKGTVYALRLN
ncbi:MAG: PQQ-binding-like beta-propeller repeat protein [Aquabacterium sp.]|uniref:PQQ-binding-like beta-propeller repeat protein n=1 Tax=Aquabacterium sp. TaxID=1872578 RepID=UPI003BEB51A4